MGNSCNHEHEEEILFAVRGGEDLAKIYFRAGICHHSDFFISSIQRSFGSTRLNCLVQKLICRDTNQQRGRQTRPKHNTYKDHVYLDRSYLLSNPTWRRAHAMAALTGRESDVKLNVLRRFL